MMWDGVTKVEIYVGGNWVDVTLFVRYLRQEVTASRGRQTELDEIEQGRLSLGLDNSGGEFTPGRAASSMSLTYGMPIRVTDTLGYRSFPAFMGKLEMPETVEQTEGIDNLISVTAVDDKQLLDNGRRFISTLAEYIMTATPSTLLHYYPLTETTAPFRDVVGQGASFEVVATETSLANPMTTGQGEYTPGGGVEAPGDDVKGVAFEPALSSGGGYGFDTTARGHVLSSTFATAASPTGAVQIAAGQALTIVAWINLPNEYDTQELFAFDLMESVALRTQVTAATLQRNLRHTSLGADQGLLAGAVVDAIGGGLAGSAKSTAIYAGTRDSAVPFALQITYTPNDIRVWVGDSEYVGTAPSGTLAAPQYCDAFTLGPITGSFSHFQVHVGAYSHADFLAQYMAGQEGLAGQRTDERIATILGYAAGGNPAVLDEGSTFLQVARLAGKTPGQAIDTAVTTERGRFFIGPDGIARFHARTRAYNL